MNKKWSIQEEKYITDNVGNLTDAKMAEELTKQTGRKITQVSIRRKRQRLGLKKARGRGYCKLENDSFLEQVYPEQ